MRKNRLAAIAAAMLIALAPAAVTAQEKADDESAVLKDVHDGQVHILASSPGVEVDDAIEGTAWRKRPASQPRTRARRRRPISAERRGRAPASRAPSRRRSPPDRGRAAETLHPRHFRIYEQ